MIRLTGGELRGHSIETPPGQRTRPTQSKLRQALFNSLQIYIDDARVLDLFAGSGALGFEALSRGAAHAVFVEHAAAAARVIDQNARKLGLRDRMTLVRERMESSWPRLATLGPFNLVFADPPYEPFCQNEGGIRTQLLEKAPWPELLAPSARLCIEWSPGEGLREPALPDDLPFLVKVREKKYGDTVLTTYLLRGEHGDDQRDPGNLSGVV